MSQDFDESAIARRSRIGNQSGQVGKRTFLHPVVGMVADHPAPGDALDALDAAGPRYLDDVHGSAFWRAAMTRRCVAEVIAELARSPGPAR